MEHTNAMFVNDYVEEEEEEENNNVSGAFTENELIEQFYNYLRDNNIKEACRLLRTYNCLNKLNTRQLNKDYPLNHYKFTKRGDVLTIYKPIEKTDRENNNRESIEDITNRLDVLEEQLREHKNKYKHDLITIRTQFKYNINKINEIKDSLNTVNARVCFNTFSIEYL
ncbi:hypothetical protein M9Y10_039943 [Tritrichomonas musculus]|uniref:LisH domain-containing protein n=1 Tax=Tritrichomonas musculus TaxID=1915356 RepID=A0ABR2GQB3_9EUKA